MKIVLATPLYPPDTAPSAAYIKELARLLSASNRVVVVAYGRIPELVDGVIIRTVDKRQTLPVRLFKYTLMLIAAARDADVVYIENGASVELSAVILSFFVRTPLVVHLGDEAAREQARNRAHLGLIERSVLRRAKAVISDTPTERPEILPFEPRPAEAKAAYEASWQHHLDILNKTFAYGR